MNGLDELHRIIAKYGIDAVRKEIEIAAKLEGGYDKDLVATMKQLKDAEQTQAEIIAENFLEDMDLGAMPKEDQDAHNEAEADEEAASEKLDELTARSAARRK